MKNVPFILQKKLHGLFGQPDILFDHAMKIGLYLAK